MLARDSSAAGSAYGSGPGSLLSRFPDFQCQLGTGYRHANVLPLSLSPPVPGTILLEKLIDMPHLFHLWNRDYFVSRHSD